MGPLADCGTQKNAPPTKMSTSKVPELVNMFHYVQEAIKVAGGITVATQLILRWGDEPRLTRWVPHNHEDTY